MGKRLPRQQTITKMAPEAALFMTRRCKLQTSRVFLSSTFLVQKGAGVCSAASGFEEPEVCILDISVNVVGFSCDYAVIRHRHWLILS